MKMLTKDQMIQIMGGVVDWEEEEGEESCDCNFKDECPENKPTCVVCPDRTNSFKQGSCQGMMI